MVVYGESRQCNLAGRDIWSTVCSRYRAGAFDFLSVKLDANSDYSSHIHHLGRIGFGLMLRRATLSNIPRIKQPRKMNAGVGETNTKKT